MYRFAFGILSGLIGTAAVIMSAFTAVSIFAPAYLPAPAISRVDHLDEKLRFLRAHPKLDPEILAVGSSITWRQLDGGTIESKLDRPGIFLNGATTHLQVHQTRDLIEQFYLPHYKNVRTLVVLTSLPDFDDCTEQPPDMLEARDAARYVFKHWPAGVFFLRYFSPGRYIRTGLRLADRRIPYQGDMYMDKYGSSPVAVSNERRRLLGLRFGEIGTDPRCTEKLVKLSKEVSKRGIHLLIVFSPIHPEYRKEFPNSFAQLTSIARIVRKTTENDDTQVMELEADKRFKADDFYDAFHLQWPAVRKLSAILAPMMSPGTERRPQPPIMSGPPPVVLDKGLAKNAPNSHSD